MPAWRSLSGLIEYNRFRLTGVVESTSGVRLNLLGPSVGLSKYAGQAETVEQKG
ncbi:MAG: hypothetical protein ACE5HC_04940 [Candidatus Binatia bacterium]